MTSRTNPTRDVKTDTGKPEAAKGRLIYLDAKPEVITLDPAMTAAIVVDMQNDFGSKGGMFDRAGIDISGIQKAVGPTVKVLVAARKLGIKIIYLKMGYKPGLSDLGTPNSVNRVRQLRLSSEKDLGPRWRREPHPDSRGTEILFIIFRGIVERFAIREVPYVRRYRFRRTEN